MRPSRLAEGGFGGRGWGTGPYSLSLGAEISPGTPGSSKKSGGRGIVVASA